MVRGRGRYVRGLAAAALIAAAALLRGAAPPPVEAAQSGLSYISVATWTVDPAMGSVHVDLEITATSKTVNSGGRRYYYPGLQLTLPLSTANYLAYDDTGQSLPVAVTAGEPSGVVVYVPFRQRLYSGQSVSFELKFDLVDPGGATDRDLRIGEDVVSFPVSAFGSEGTPGGWVSVVFPAGYIVQEQFGSLTSSVTGGGETVFSSGPVPDATALDAWFTASRTMPDADFRTEQITVGPLAVTLRYWSDDPGWADQVAQVLQAGYPLLSQMIGIGDPTAKTLTVEEATTQGIDGFSGDYDPNFSLARVSYFADPIVILHEVAHMWFNGSLASDRWIDEGFASYYAEQAVLQLRMPDHAPVLSPSLMPAAIPLNDWTSAGAPDTATEAYLYGASLEVARRIVAIAGTADMSEVWAEARAGTGAYAGPSGLPASGPADWRSFLDYLEQTTGQSFTPIWQQWVMTPSQVGLLNDRASARVDYAATQAAAGGWLLGPDVREAMDSWQFTSATALLSQAREVQVLRQEIGTDAAAEGTTPPGTLQTIFQTVGAGAAVTEAQKELSALDDLSAALEARAESKSAAKAVGLLGTDPDADLEAAQKAFANGDLGQAVSMADSARSAWTGAGAVGQIRILGTAAGTAGVLLLLALYVWTRSGRPRAKVAADAGTATAGRLHD